MYFLKSKFGKDVEAIRKLRKQEIKAVSYALSIDRQVWKRVEKGKGVQGATLALIAHWTGLDVRSYVVDSDPNQATQKSFRFEQNPKPAATRVADSTE